MITTKPVRLQDHFAELTDPRKRKVTYPLVNVIAIAICAVICGADDFVAIAAFGRKKREQFETFLDLREGIPPRPTVLREAVGAARVKIGVATDPEARIAGLQTACPHPLRHLGAIPGGREVEASLHSRLHNYHLSGEWFFLAKPVSALIAHLTAPPAEGPTA